MTYLFACTCEKKNEHETAYRLLAAAVKKVWDLDTLPEVARAPGGKPYFPHKTQYHFSLSHSGGLCLCAVSDASVGADIELIRPRGKGLPRRALDAREHAWYLERGGSWEDFYLLWTRREARVKQQGGSVFAPRREALPLPGESADYCLCSYAGETWRAAVACEGDTPGEILWTELSAKEDPAREE